MRFILGLSKVHFRSISGPFQVHFRFISNLFLLHFRTISGHFWVILEHCDFLGTFLGSQQFFLGRGWNDWQAMHPEDLCNLKEDFIIWMIIGHLKNAVGGPLLGEFMMPMQFWNFFFWQILGRKGRKTGRRATTKDEKDEKAMTRGNELVSFLVIATKWTCYVLHRVRKEVM